jgi:hypothetical protein
MVPSASAAELVPSSAPSQAAALPAVGSWAIGWSAAVVTTASGHELRALDPSGKPTTVGQVPTGTTVVDVRHDARRVITKSAHGQEDPVVFKVWDVATGKSWQVTLQKGSDLYFGPDDKLISAYYYPTPRTMLRTAAGSPIRALSLPGGWHGAVSPGGTAIYTGGSGGMKMFSVAANRVVRTIPQQPNNISCVPGGLWSDGQMRFGCYDIPGTSLFYKANATTGAVTRLVRNIRDAGLGFATNPPTGTSIWLSSCVEPGFVATDDGTRATPVVPAGPWGAGETNDHAVAGRGTSLWMTVAWSCADDEKRTSLVRFDTSTRKTTVLTGPSSASTVGSVRSVQTIDGLT